MNPSQYINLFAGRWKWLDYPAIFFARGLAYVLVAGLFAVAFFQKNPAMFFVPVFSGAISRFTINELIWLFYKEERPSSLALTKVLINNPHSPSFPSSHVSFFSTISFLLFFYNIPLAIVFTVCTVFIGIARVFCGVHWLRDVFAGILIGLVSAFIAAIILGWNPALLRSKP